MLIATSKDGDVLIAKDEHSSPVLVRMNESEEVVEETKSQKKAPPKTLQSSRILPLSDSRAVITGKDGHIFVADFADMADGTQSAFQQRLKLASDTGHTMPVLQLLPLDESTFISLGYDRTVVAWQVAADFVDQVARLPCLGQSIDRGMIKFATPDEILVV